MKAWIDVERDSDNLNLKPYAQTSDGSTQHLIYELEVSQKSASGGTSQSQQSGTVEIGPEPTLLSNAALFLYPESTVKAVLRLYRGSGGAPIEEAVSEYPPLS